MPITFAYPQFLLLVLLVVPILWYAARRRKAVGHSHVGLHKNVRNVPLLGRLPTILLVAFWTLVCVALTRPQLTETGEKEVINTRDFVIATDISGSMSATISDPAQIDLAGSTSNGQPRQVNRLMVAEKAIELFIRERQGDRVALFLFDDETYYSWPLSKDLKVIKLKNQGISRYSGGGTNFEGAKGPIPAAIAHFKELGQAKTKILIMVTDGEDNISEDRFQELLQQMLDQGIKIYTLGIGDSWVTGSGFTQDLENLTKATGGKVIPVGNAEEMRSGFATINQLERSNVEIEKTVSYHDIYHYFLIAALVTAVLYLCSSVLVREDV